MKVVGESKMHTMHVLYVACKIPEPLLSKYILPFLSNCDYHREMQNIY